MNSVYVIIKDLRNNAVIAKGYCSPDNYNNFVYELLSKFIKLSESDRYELAARLDEYQSCEFLGYFIILKDNSEKEWRRYFPEDYKDYINDLIAKETLLLNCDESDYYVFQDEEDRERWLELLTKRIDRYGYWDVSYDVNYNYLTNIYKTEFENFKNNVEKELGSFPLDVKTEPNLVRAAMEIWYIRLFEKDVEWGYLPDIVE